MQKEGLLRGFSPRESPTPNTIVVVESDNYKYRLHANRECRTPVGTKGSRDEVNLNKNESRNSCRSKCEALGDNCFGYSISTSGQCEVWNVKIGDYNDMVFSEGVDCLVREGSIEPAVGELPLVIQNIRNTAAAQRTGQEARMVKNGICSRRSPKIAVVRG